MKIDPVYIAAWIFFLVFVTGYGFGLYNLIREKRTWAVIIMLVLVGAPLAQLSVFIIKQELADHEWWFRKELPQDVVEISEWRYADGFIPDYSYYLRAKISRTEFDHYISKLGLTPHTPNRKYRGAFSGPYWKNDRADWWNPSEDNGETYVDQSIEDEWTFAKYENGYLYLHSYNH